MGRLKTSPSNILNNRNALENARRMRMNLLSGLTGDTLGIALDAFERGDIRQAVLYWQSMAERDDVIPNVKGKREKSTASRDWQIIESPRARRLKKRSEINGAAFDADAAKRHADVLFDFWDTVTAVNAYDRNDSGGMVKLIRQMMTSVSFKYAAHHILWKPRTNADGSHELRAEFEFVPLQFFENRTGTLRFCGSGYETEGVTLDPSEWMITCGDGLMIAGSIDYLIKRNAIIDWMLYSERCGVPVPVGKTKHAKGTDGGNAMVEAVESINNDSAVVVFEDQGDSSIEFLATQGAQSLPFDKLVERADRHLAALFRGADLGSMSSGAAGQGAGASLQGDETDLLEKDDASTIEEKLDEISRRVLQWHFGADVKPLAYLKIIVPTKEQKLFMEAVEMIVKHGGKVAVSDVMEHLGITGASEGDELMKPPADYTSSYSQAFKAGETNGSGLDLMNERTADNADVQTNARRDDDAAFLRDCMQLLAEARVEDQQPIARALKECLAQPDDGLMPALLAFNAQLPDYVAKDAAQVKAWHSIIASAQLRGWTLGAHPASSES